MSPSPLTRLVPCDTSREANKPISSRKQKIHSDTIAKKVVTKDSKREDEEIITTDTATTPSHIQHATPQPIISEESRQRISEARALFEAKTPRDSPTLTPRTYSPAGHSATNQSTATLKDSNADTRVSRSPDSVTKLRNDCPQNNLLFEILGLKMNTSD